MTVDAVAKVPTAPVAVPVIVDDALAFKLCDKTAMPVAVMLELAVAE